SGVDHAPGFKPRIPQVIERFALIGLDLRGVLPETLAFHVQRSVQPLYCDTELRRVRRRSASRPSLCFDRGGENPTAVNAVLVGKVAEDVAQVGRARDGRARVEALLLPLIGQALADLAGLLVELLPPLLQDRPVDGVPPLLLGEAVLLPHREVELLR